MSNTINPNSPANLPPTTNPVDSANPTAPGNEVAFLEQTLRNASPDQINSMRTMFVEAKRHKAVDEAIKSGEDPNLAAKAVDMDPTVGHLDKTISEYEAGRASLTDLATAFVAVKASG